MAKGNTRGSSKKGMGKTQVNVWLDREIKEAVVAAADRHGRTQGAQFEQTIKDGVGLQDLIAKISEHLGNAVETSTGVTITYKPNEDDCILYIRSAVELVMKQEKGAKGN